MQIDSCKPLSYPASKCVLQHLEANFRLILASCCPSLQNLDKVVPLTVEYLKLDSDHYDLNDQRHQFLRNGSGAQLRITKSDDAESEHPVEYWDDEVDLEPSDVKLGTFPHQAHPPNHPEQARHTYLQNLAGFYEAFLNRAQANGGEIDPSRLVPGTLVRIHQVLSMLGGLQPEVLYLGSVVLVQPQNQEILEQLIQACQDLIQEAREHSDLEEDLPANLFQIARQGQQPLAIKNLHGANSRDAIRRHIEKIFRRNMIVKTLRIDFLQGILTIPENLKFKVRNVFIVHDEVLPYIPRIVDMANSPLRTLIVDSVENIPEFSRDLLLNSFARLEICQEGYYMDHRIFQWGHYLRKLRNKEVHITGLKVTRRQIAGLVRDWVTDNREIGTKLSMEFSRKWSARKLFEELAQLKGDLGVLDNGHPGGFIYPYDEEREIKIYGKPVLNEKDEWMLVIEVIEKC